MDWRTELKETGKTARQAARGMAVISAEGKNRALCAMADALEAECVAILAANADDVGKARTGGMSESLLDRLALNPARVRGMADGLREIAALPDPVGEVTGMRQRPNGLTVGRIRVPLGVIAMIYESRPNVTADAAGLCLKAGNAVILRGGSEAIGSNSAIAAVLATAAAQNGLPAGCVQ